jgi:UDP-N-acetylmuramyl pentapeptide phosphotransferase/UDP-N-acetylglucosamine-1-phosphate transferase
MIFYIYLFLVSFIILMFNKYCLSKNILISESGDIHQKFATVSKVPLTGGIILYLGLIFITKDDVYLSFVLTMLFTLGILADLKIIRSAKIRLILQILIIFFIVFSLDLRINDIRIDIFNHFLTINYINYIFVVFCILVTINGSNFLDGLNTLNIGYFLSVFTIIFYLEYTGKIQIGNFSLKYFLIILLTLFILNLLNFLYLGDSGSYIQGFISSVLLIKIYSLNSFMSPYFIVLLLWYPCFENLFSIIRKKKLNLSSMQPDTNHLHQLIFYFFEKKFQFNKLIINIISANLINIYNLVIFYVSFTYLDYTKLMIIFILLNTCLYTLVYFRLFLYKHKKI